MPVDREAELLPVPYYHVVFTLPAPIADIAFQNRITRCLFVPMKVLDFRRSRENCCK